MKVRRSARTILGSILLLSTFTLLTIWHNGNPNTLEVQDRIDLISELSQSVNDPGAFQDMIDQLPENSGFYVLGISTPSKWPESLRSASYSDPLASLSQASLTKTLNRYRSRDDFLLLLKRVDQRSPDLLASIDLQDYEIIQEPTLIVSYRLVFSVGIAGLGLMIVRFFNRKKSPLSQT